MWEPLATWPHCGGALGEECSGALHCLLASTLAPRTPEPDQRTGCERGLFSPLPTVDASLSFPGSADTWMMHLA